MEKLIALKNAEGYFLMCQFLVFLNIGLDFNRKQDYWGKLTEHSKYRRQHNILSPDKGQKV